MYILTLHTGLEEFTYLGDIIVYLQTENFIVQESDDKRNNDTNDSSDDRDDSVPEPQCLVPHPCGAVPDAAQLAESN